MSLAKLTSVSTKTLSLLLERQRLQSLPSFSGTSSTNSVSNGTSLHFPQIKRNMTRLREGILELEGQNGQSEAVGLLRKQYDRMRGMLREEEQSEIPRSVTFFLFGFTYTYTDYFYLLPSESSQGVLHHQRRRTYLTHFQYLQQPSDGTLYYLNLRLHHTRMIRNRVWVLNSQSQQPCCKLNVF